MNLKLREFIYFNRKKIISFFLIILVIVASYGSYYLYSTFDKVKADDKEETIVLEKDNKKDEEEVNEIVYCYFDIKGEIKKPGVYKIDCNKRVVDAIKESGGLTKNADTSLINLSKKITDSMVIKIYSKSDIKKYSEIKQKEEKLEELCKNDNINNDACISNKPKTTENNSSLVNINKASIEELMQLPGVGESKAKAIIEYRNKTPFKSIEDIKNVSGIGTALYDKIKENITI